MSAPVIVVEGLRKAYGDVVAVAGLDFTVDAGVVLGLLGPNGAGKTTTIEILTTLRQADAGRATIAGFDVATEPERVRRVIGLAGQAAAVDDRLTARENLDLFARLYKLPASVRRARVDELIERFDLGGFADRLVATYSGGQRRRLDVVAALIARPPAIFLDEPTTGLDPRSRLGLWEEIRRMAADGAAVVLTTQYLEEADRLADHIVIIDRGEVVARGTAEDLKKDLGRDVLVIHVTDADDLPRAAELAGDGVDVGTDVGHRMLTVQLAGGPPQGLDILKRLADAGIPVDDFQLRRPTLDDVFLTHTEARR